MKKLFITVSIIIMVILLTWVHVNLLSLVFRLWPLWLVIIIVSFLINVFLDKN